MPLITDLKPQRRDGFINIIVDGEYWCGLSDYQVVIQGIHIGDEYDLSTLESWKEVAEGSKAYAAAIRYLSYRIRTEGEVRDYLRRKEFANDIDVTIERLLAEKYINDTDFAGRWVVMRITQHRSPRHIRSELLNKKVDQYIVDEALLAYDTESIQSQIIQIAQKKVASGETTQKIIQFLNRKGYAYQDIKQALDSLT